MSENKKKFDLGIDRQVIRGTSIMGTFENGSPARVDLKDGKITRKRPLHFDWKYDAKDFNAWKFEAKGSTLTPPLKALPGPIGLL